MHLRKIIASLALLAFAGAIAAGCSSSNSIPKGSICAVYGTGIKKSAYEKLIGQAQRNYTSQGQKFPKTGTAEYKTLTEQAVDYLITQQLYAREAKAAGVKVSDKDVTKRLDQLKQSFFHGDAKAYKAELAKQHLTDQDVKDNLKLQLVNEGLFKKATKDVTVSDSKAKAYYDQNPSQYQTPESRQVAHILVKTQALANTIYKQVKGGNQKTFAALAKKYSQDPSSAQNGGVLTIQKGQTVPEFDATAFKLANNATSPPVHTQFGWHVIQARGPIIPAKKQDFKSVESQIKQQLVQEDKSKRMSDWQQSVIKRAKTNVNCGKGYVWTSTVKSSANSGATPSATPAPSSSSAPSTPPPASTPATSTKGTKPASTPAPSSKPATTSKPAASSTKGKK
jgi:parvulin-like peptidyl-prolyl isomerase